MLYDFIYLKCSIKIEFLLYWNCFFELIEMPVYDKFYCRIGTFFSWVEADGNYKNYGVFLDPYLSETWNFPYNTLLPLPTEYMTNAKDTIWLNKTIDEMKSYWHQYYQHW